MPPSTVSPSDEAPLRVLIIDEDLERAKLVKEGLLDDAVVQMATQMHGRGLLDLISNWHPDVIIMECNSPDRDTIESLRQVAQTNPKPIVMFVEKDGRGFMQDAIEAGVSAYVIDGLTPSRVRPLIDTAIARFKHIDGLKAELRQTKEDLAARKVIERAKGLLMERQGIKEAEAFRTMRDMSQRQGKPLKDIAENIISVLDMLETRSAPETKE
ncbi:MAG: ANTAR domain-containing protein [Pseudomonadota bacterium]